MVHQNWIGSGWRKMGLKTFGFLRQQEPPTDHRNNKPALKHGSPVSVFEITHSAVEFLMKIYKNPHFEAKRKLYKLSGQGRVINKMLIFKHVTQKKMNPHPFSFYLPQNCGNWLKKLSQTFILSFTQDIELKQLLHKL